MDLETRVRRLERWNRGLVACLLLAAVASCISARGGPELLTVRSLTVVDDQGRQRAAILCDDKQVSFALWGPDSQERFKAVCKDSGDSDVSIKAAGNHGNVFLTSGEGLAMVSLMHENGTPLATLIRTGDIPELGLRGKDNKLIWSPPLVVP